VIVGTGVDLAEVPRIRASIARFGAKFVDRIFTPAEIAYVERKANRYERYAANLPSGKPTLRLHGVAATVAARLGVRNISLSLTHTAELGMAHVILED
jgi:holo-[acyl-carrier protein] synthase